MTTTAVVRDFTLTELEEVIESGLMTFVEVGQALITIRDRKLYREQFGTFQEYCIQRWRFDRVYAHRLMRAAEITEMLPMGNKPASEREARALGPISHDPDQMLEAMQEAREETGGKVTAAAVERAVAKRTPSKPSRERRSVSSGADRSDFADAPEDAADLGFTDAPAEAQVVSNEPAIQGKPERFCSNCGDRYRGEACPCVTVTPEAEPLAVSTQSAPVVYQPAIRTSSTGLGKPPAPSTPTYSGPPPITLQGGAADVMRAISDRFALDKVAEGIGEAYPDAERRSLVVQLIDSLPTDLLTSVAHRINVRVRPVKSDTAEIPTSTSLADWEQAAVERLTPGTRIGLVKRLIDGLADDQQRRFWEMFPERTAAAPAEPQTVTIASIDALAAEHLTVSQQLAVMSRFLDRQDEQGQRALFERLKLKFEPKSDRELLTGRAS